MEKLIHKISKRTDESCSDLEKKLNELELNTLWKIKDYEKLLEQRPTQIFVEEELQKAVHSVKSQANRYTDIEIEKYKNSEGSLKNVIERN
jgi:hypothetical protein